MQLNQSMKNGDYTLAGDQLNPFERIVESRSVEVPHASQEEKDHRRAYRAPSDTASGRLSIALPWALLMIAAAVTIMSMITLQKEARRTALAEELDHLRNRYLAVEQERQDLEEQYLQASDSSHITYYAAQNLKMRRALSEETIQVTAPSTRPAVHMTAQGGMGVSGRH